MATEPTNSQDIRNSLKLMLAHIGDNPDREGLLETPDRIIKSWSELFSGYTQLPCDILKTFSDGACDEMVILKNIEFYSFCEHHFLPFFGTVSIGYIPNKRVIGLSKLARLVDIFARRLQIQEKMTGQIADALMDTLDPKGVIVTCEAKHFCMVARGVKKGNGVMITSALRGVFLTNPQAKSEFLSLTN